MGAVTTDLDKDIDKLKKEIGRIEQELNEMLGSTDLRPAATTDQGVAFRKNREQIQNTAETFKVALNMVDFKPDEIKVLVKDGGLRIEANHEEGTTENGKVSRMLVQKYTLPKDVDVEAVTSRLSKDGFLYIEAPKKAQPTDANKGQ